MSWHISVLKEPILRWFNHLVLSQPKGEVTQSRARLLLCFSLQNKDRCSSAFCLYRLWVQTVLIYSEWACEWSRLGDSEELHPEHMCFCRWDVLSVGMVSYNSVPFFFIILHSQFRNIIAVNFWPNSERILRCGSLSQALQNMCPTMSLWSHSVILL